MCWCRGVGHNGGGRFPRPFHRTVRCSVEKLMIKLYSASTRVRVYARLSRVSKYGIVVKSVLRIL